MDVKKLRQLAEEYEAQRPEPEQVPADQPGAQVIGDAFREHLAKLEKGAQEMRAAFAHLGAFADRGRCPGFPHGMDSIQERARAVEKMAAQLTHQATAQPAQRFIPNVERFPLLSEPTERVPVSKLHQLKAGIESVVSERNELRQENAELRQMLFRGQSEN